MSQNAAALILLSFCAIAILSIPSKRKTNADLSKSTLEVSNLFSSMIGAFLGFIFAAILVYIQDDNNKDISHIKAKKDFLAKSGFLMTDVTRAAFLSKQASDVSKDIVEYCNSGNDSREGIIENLNRLNFFQRKMSMTNINILQRLENLGDFFLEMPLEFINTTYQAASIIQEAEADNKNSNLQINSIISGYAIYNLVQEINQDKNKMAKLFVCGSIRNMAKIPSLTLYLQKVVIRNLCIVQDIVRSGAEFKKDLLKEFEGMNIKNSKNLEATKYYSFSKNNCDLYSSSILEDGIVYLE